MGNVSFQCRQSYIGRVFRLIARFVRGRVFGIWFTGMSRFRIPPSIQINARRVDISAPSEIGVSWDFVNVALDDEYGLLKISGKPDTVLDIGANFGLFSILAAHYFSSSKIHAYEPNPRIFPFLVQNGSKSGVVPFQAGVGSCEGRADIQDKGDSRLARTNTHDLFSLGDSPRESISTHR
jgi:hypothetical protein